MVRMAGIELRVCGFADRYFIGIGAFVAPPPIMPIPPLPPMPPMPPAIGQAPCMSFIMACMSCICSIIIGMRAWGSPVFCMAAMRALSLIHISEPTRPY